MNIRFAMFGALILTTGMIFAAEQKTRPEKTQPENGLVACHRKVKTSQGKEKLVVLGHKGCVKKDPNICCQSYWSDYSYHENGVAHCYVKRFRYQERKKRHEYIGIAKAIPGKMPAKSCQRVYEIKGIWMHE